MVLMQVEWNEISRSSWFNVSFGDGLGDQLLTISQAYWFGTELGLFANGF